MIVLYRNGEKTVITGWRAWLILLAVALGVVVIGALVLGFALTLLTLALFAIPVAIGLALIASLFARR